MSFKRTSEGRVFFQGDDETNLGDTYVSPTSRPLSGGSGLGSNGYGGGGYMSDSQTQLQIVTLLKALNERLKATQAERNVMRKELDAYKNLINELEGKAERSEKAYIQLEQKIIRAGQDGGKKAEEITADALKEMAETRKLLLSVEGKTESVDRALEELKNHVERHQKVGNQLLQKQSALEKTQQQHAQKVADHSHIASKIVQRLKDGEQRFEGLTDRVNQTESEQAKIARKLEKAMEERARFMRKIERIEETVIQTRDALNARAMVLLTDKNANGAEDVYDQQQAPETPSSMPAAAPVTEKRGPIFVKAERPTLKLKSMQAAMFAAAGVLMVSGGLFYVLLDNPTMMHSPAASYPPQIESPALSPRFDAAKPADNASNAALLNEIQKIENMEWKIRQDFKANDTLETPSENTPPTTGQGDLKVEDMSPAPSEAEQTSQLKAAPLFNDDIGTLDLSDPAQVQAALEGDTQKIAAALNNIEPDVPAEKNLAPVVEAAPLSDPKTLAKADKNLPANFKDIETQAFDGVAAAQHDLAAIYTAGHAGVEQDFSRARFWFEQAAARGIENAAYNLGVIHHQGLGVEPNIRQALEWYEKAANLGHPEAQYNLGIAYIEGIGVGYDSQKAADFFQKAAKSGIMEAAYNLGLIHENGLLGSAKPDEALMWYKIAADQGSPEAKQALQQLADNLSIGEDEVNRLADSMKASKKPLEGQSPAQRARSTSPNPSVTNQAIVSQIQEILMQRGLYPGPADGLSGPLTIDAIRAFQRQNNLPVDGEINEKLLDYMMKKS